MAVDPFLPAYAPFTGARLPELWEYLWLSEETKPPVHGYLTDSESETEPPDLCSYPPIHCDMTVQLASHVLSAPPGPSLLRRNAGMVVQSLFVPNSYTVFELVPRLVAALRKGTSAAEFSRSWADELAGHPVPGPPEAVLRSMLVNGAVEATGWSGYPTGGSDVTCRSGDVLVGYETDGSARMLAFSTGHRLVLSPGAAAWWRALEGSSAAEWLASDSPERSLFLALAGLGFASLERR
jgi:hypothetical protein